MNRVTREITNDMPSRNYRAHYELPDFPADRTKAVSLLQAQIVQAFDDTKLEGGIGLWEAQAIDDRESDEERATRRADDERDDWRRLSPESLNRCHSSPSFFDAQGFRFHLPAYLLAELDGVYGFDFFWHLIHYKPGETGAYSLLSSAQRNVVQSYLALLATDPEHENSQKDIMYALVDHWATNEYQVPLPRPGSP